MFCAIGHAKSVLHCTCYAFALHLHHFRNILPLLVRLRVISPLRMMHLLLRYGRCGVMPYNHKDVLLMPSSAGVNLSNMAVIEPK